MFKKALLVLVILAILPLGSVFAQDADSEIRSLVESFVIEGESDRNIDYIVHSLEGIMDAVGAIDYSIEGNVMEIQANQWIQPSNSRYGCGGGMQGVFMVEVEPCIGWEEHQQGGETIYTSAKYRDGIFNVVILPPTNNPTSNMLEWEEVSLDVLPTEMQEVALAGCDDEPRIFVNLTRSFVVCQFRMYGGTALLLGGIIANDNVGGQTVYQPYSSIIDAEGNYLYTVFENGVSEDWQYYFGAPDINDDVESALAQMLDDLPDMTEVLFEPFPQN